MAQLQPGDRILHYANTAIRAIGRVVAPAVEAPRPAELPTDAWGERGNLARVDYAPLKELIRLNEIPLEWRQPRPGPFTQGNSVKQG